MNKGKIPILSIALYIISGMLVLYTVWALSHSIGYTSELVAMGQLTFKGNEYDILSFYMSSSGQYALFMIIIFSLGWMLQKISSGTSRNHDAQNQVTISEEISSNGTNEDDFEDWFQNSDK